MYVRPSFLTLARLAEFRAAQRRRMAAQADQYARRLLRAMEQAERLALENRNMQETDPCPR